jgi:argininosuccinate lyase
MPQKKNPDTAELARGKAGRVYGHLFAMLTVMKGLPLAYNRDLQEDKEGFFDTVDTLVSSIDIMCGLVASTKINAARMKYSMQSYILATDVADYLVNRGMSFREAHDVVSRVVAYAIANNRELNELDIKEYKGFSEMFEKDVLAITLQKSVEARSSQGGTATAEVKKSIESARVAVNGYGRQRD